MLGMGKLAPVWSKVSGLTVTHGEGSHVYTVEGDRYLDFTSGIAVASTGHAHPVVVEAISQQAKRFLHAQVNCYHHDLLQPLADLLDDITPAGIDTFFYTNSGAEATEAAVKLAKQHTRRSVIGVFDGSFHGRTFAAIAASGDVNVNAIAPGTAAALAATVAGLLVAIPCLFGYNWLDTRIKAITTENRVFTDEVVTRIAEQFSA